MHQQRLHRHFHSIGLGRVSPAVSDSTKATLLSRQTAPNLTPNTASLKSLRCIKTHLFQLPKNLIFPTLRHEHASPSQSPRATATHRSCGLQIRDSTNALNPSQSAAGPPREAAAAAKQQCLAVAVPVLSAALHLPLLPPVSKSHYQSTTRLQNFCIVAFVSPPSPPIHYSPPPVIKKYSFCVPGLKILLHSPFGKPSRPQRGTKTP